MPQRLDRALAARLPEWSRTRLQALIRDGGVRVNGGVALRPSREVAEDDDIVYEVAATPPKPARLAAEDIPLDILYEDEDLAAIHKPAGLLVHPGAGQRGGTLVGALLHRYGSLSGSGGSERPGIVHRLDRYTSGVMVVARNDFAHLGLARQFQARTVRKTYLALVHGRMGEAAGDIQLAIGRDRQRRTRMTTKRSEAHSRAAHSRYRTLESWTGPPAYSWLEVEILTGRTHQIRVHMAAIGHPVVGDRLYGAPAALTGPRAVAGLRPERVMLHSARLELAHPRSGAPLRFEAPVPAAMTALLQRLRAV